MKPKKPKYRMMVFNITEEQSLKLFFKFIQPADQFNMQTAPRRFKAGNQFGIAIY